MRTYCYFSFRSLSKQAWKCFLTDFSNLRIKMKEIQKFNWFDYFDPVLFQNQGFVVIWHL